MKSHEAATESLQEKWVELFPSSLLYNKITIVETHTDSFNAPSRKY